MKTSVELKTSIIPLFLGFFSVAFHAVVITEFPTIRSQTKIKFDRVKLNVGNGYVYIIYDVSFLCYAVT